MNCFYDFNIFKPMIFHFLIFLKNINISNIFFTEKKKFNGLSQFFLLCFTTKTNKVYHFFNLKLMLYSGLKVKLISSDRNQESLFDFKEISNINEEEYELESSNFFVKVQNEFIDSSAYINDVFCKFVK